MDTYIYPLCPRNYPQQGKEQLFVNVKTFYKSPLFILYSMCGCNKISQEGGALTFDGHDLFEIGFIITGHPLLSPLVYDTMTCDIKTAQKESFINGFCACSCPQPELTVPRTHSSQCSALTQA